MKAIVQRVTSASVTVNGEVISSIGRGLCVLIGIHKDDQKDSQESLIKINVWFAEQLKYLAERLEQTPEPGGEGSMLDHTTIVWTNELGKGNSHTLDNIPFVLLGNGCKFQMGRSLKYDKLAHNRLLMSFAHSVGHRVETFGNPKLSAGGPLDLG